MGVSRRNRENNGTQSAPGQDGTLPLGRRGMGGVFAQRNYSVVYPRNTPENHPLTEACMIHSK